MHHIFQDPKMGQEFLPVLFIPQLLFAGFFVPTGELPSCILVSFIDCTTNEISLASIYDISSSHMFYALLTFSLLSVVRIHSSMVTMGSISMFIDLCSTFGLGR